jgi:3-deoxy-7-phosphoheptulonate synthase
LIVEVHHQPDKALSDGMQSILPEQFAQLMDECSQIATVLHRTVPRGIHVEDAAIAK